MADQPYYLTLVGLPRRGSAETVVGSLQRLEMQGKLKLCNAAVLYKNARGRIRLDPSPPRGMEPDPIVALMVGLAVGGPLRGALADAAAGSGASETGVVRQALQQKLDHVLSAYEAVLCAIAQNVDLLALEAESSLGPVLSLDELQPRTLKSFQYLASNERLADTAVTPLYEVDMERPEETKGPGA